jgi:hypothetical protein
MKKLLPLLLLLVVITACRETVISTAKINIPEKLVVGCFINPQDDTLYATVTLSKPLYKRNNNPFDFDIINNATVQISDGNNSTNFTFNSDLERYILPAASFNIVAGSTYTLTVSTPDGKRVIASTTVPTVQNFNYSFTVTPQEPLNEFEKRALLEARWQGVAGPDRFYRFNYGVKTSSELFVDEYWPNSDEWNGAQFYSDAQQENRLFRFRENIYLGWVGEPGNETTTSLTGLLQELDVHSFRYFRSLAAQLNTSGGFSEPVVVYSNVEGGLGCFGSSFEYEIQRDSL